MKQIKPLLAISYPLKAKLEAKFAFSNPDSPPIIIYQMGKVGSTTVYKSLMEASISNPIIHVHFLSQDLNKHRQTHRQAGRYPMPYHIYLGEATRRLLDLNQDFPMKIISLVRDPIAFVISDLFQNPDFAEESVLNDSGFIDPQKATQYLKRKLSDQETFTYIYEWFDKELKAVFGIDVFSNSFPLESGHAVYSKAKVEALVIRLEDLSKNGPKAISEFLGLDKPLMLEQSNIRTKAKTKGAYQEVLESVSLSQSMCKKIYSSKFVNHFYNQQMIERFISKWTA